MATSARYHIDHRTTYRYESAVSLSRQHLHLTPRDGAWQRCLEQCIVIDPEPTHCHSRVDHFGNPVTQFDIEAPHSRLVVRAQSTVEVRSHAMAQCDLRSSASWEDGARALAYGAAPVLLEANRFLFESPYVRVKREFAAYAMPSFTPGRALLDAAFDLMRRIHGEFEFDPEATTVATPVLKILEDKRGVCQDFAHLMLACLRSLGLPARYVSGYLLTQPPPGQPRLIGADASHAWISLYCPNADGGTWIDFDPTNNLLPDTQHITLAWGRDFGDVSPLRGVILGGDAHELDVAVTVTPLEPAPSTDEGSAL
ncbi:MAG: transglutaminase domain protein [Proteobacteria bacterium]|nr:transglutaminase domain protein [Pseudomonadota bacterium]